MHKRCLSESTLILVLHLFGPHYACALEVLKSDNALHLNDKRLMLCWRHPSKRGPMDFEKEHISLKEPTLSWTKCRTPPLGRFLGLPSCRFLPSLSSSPAGEAAEEVDASRRSNSLKRFGKKNKKKKKNDFRKTEGNKVKCMDFLRRHSAGRDGYGKSMHLPWPQSLLSSAHVHRTWPSPHWFGSVHVRTWKKCR